MSDADTLRRIADHFWEGELPDHGDPTTAVAQEWAKVLRRIARQLDDETADHEVRRAHAAVDELPAPICTCQQLRNPLGPGRPHEPWCPVVRVAENDVNRRGIRGRSKEDA